MLERLIFRAGFFGLFWLILASAAFSQEITQVQIPPKFDADRIFAANVRSLTLSSTQPAAGRYITGKQVLDQLVAQLTPERNQFSWEIRIAKDAGNVFASPDGTIFVDEGLARLLGSNRGFWAAALAHEIAHIVRRDWARRYLFQQSLERSVAGQTDLGSPLMGDSSWRDRSSSETLFVSFCRRQELDADGEALALMARAGYHPNFMPAFYHLLQAQPQLDPRLLDAEHPSWDDRYKQLRSLFVGAGREFIRLWPAPYISPGGNPPTVVYAGEPTERRNSDQGTELQVPLHCENLYGSIEVVLRLTSRDRSFMREWHQDTGCTSSSTVISFPLSGSGLESTHSNLQAVVTILDDHGGLLSRSLALKPIRCTSLVGSLRAERNSPSFHTTIDSSRPTP